MPNTINAQLTPAGNDSLQRVTEELECKTNIIDDQLAFTLSQTYKKPSGSSDQGRCGED